MGSVNCLCIVTSIPLEYESNRARVNGRVERTLSGAKIFTALRIDPTDRAQARRFLFASAS
ncbi:MAG TPA: hypothetical protein VM580_19370 [Labilithrix sp.]|nr:hypothetical protein [Labilithrix sp.]